VAIEEIQQEDWAEKVYKPDILNKPEKLYKKPGYSIRSAAYSMHRYSFFTGTPNLLPNLRNSVASAFR
jgi:hypothetical protein